MLHAWIGWLRWATSFPEKRRTLAHLSVSDDIAGESHQAVGRSQAALVTLLERSREHGPVRDAPLMFVASLMNALAEATIDFTIRDPANADAYATAGFDALWRVVG